MKILLDLQGCQSKGSSTRGIGRYSLAFSEALIRNGGQHEFWVLLNGSFPDTAAALAARFAPQVGADRIKVFHSPRGSAESAHPDLWRTRAGEIARRHAIRWARPDLVHVSSLFEGLIDDAVTGVDPQDGPLTSVTLYDLIPYLYAERYLAGESTRKWYMRKLEALKRTDLLLGISQSACEEASGLLPPSTPVVNVSTASDPLLFCPDGPKETGAAFGLVRPFVMYTGGIDWRKNIDGLVQAWAALPAGLRQRHQLALVCHAQEHAVTEIRAQARKLGLGPDEVTLTGFVPDETLAALYRSCALFVFPSLHEGFGLPALEAMMCGAPVIGAASSSVPEVIGWEEALFDPRSTPAMAAMLQRGLEDEAFRARLRANAGERAAAFSWDRTGREAIAAMEALWAGRRGARAPATPEPEPGPGPAANAAPPSASARPRLALVAPLPPLKSGIAEYTLGLAQALEPHYQITFITDQAQVSLPAALAGLEVRDPGWLKANRESFQRVLYQMGNSVLHKYMLGLLRAVPGVVVMHDFFLSGMLNWLEMLGQPVAFSQELFGSHGVEALAFDRAQGRDASVRAYPCNRSVLDRATGVIVQSPMSVALAQRWYGEGYAAHWRVIPLVRELPATPQRTQARAALGLAGDEFLVCCFGHLGPSKLNHRLLAAWRQAGLGRARLVFVGENHRPPYGDEVEALVRKLPPGQASITGYVDAQAYERYLAACDLAVQLRTDSRGETSGAVLDCLAWGTPVLANAHGTMRDYDPAVVAQVPDAFSDAELAQALQRLRADAPARTAMAEAGRAWVAQRHNPLEIARRYVEAIEAFSAQPQNTAYWALVADIAALGPADPQALVDTAVAVEATVGAAAGLAG